MDPKGTVLPGIRRETMCSFIFRYDKDKLTAGVVYTVDHLLSRRDFVEALVESGGELAINIHLDGQFNCHVDLGPETLKVIADLRIRYSVECFP